MSSFTFFFFFVCIIAVLFLAINLLLAPRNPYSEKLSVFECGFHSFSQSRTPFNISFFIYALLFLILDLEILLMYPYAVSSYVNNVYGLVLVLIFTIILTIGFVYEIGRGALQLDSRQNLQNKLPNKAMQKISCIESKQFNNLILNNMGIFDQKRK